MLLYFSTSVAQRRDSLLEIAEDITQNMIGIAAERRCGKPGLLRSEPSLADRDTAARREMDQLIENVSH